VMLHLPLYWIGYLRVSARRSALRRTHEHAIGAEIILDNSAPFGFSCLIQTSRPYSYVCPDPAAL